jgi:hypothetical protein
MMKRGIDVRAVVGIDIDLGQVDGIAFAVPPDQFDVRSKRLQASLEHIVMQGQSDVYPT